MNLEQYRKTLGWSKRELANRADMDVNTVTKAMQGGSISLKTARKLAQAISRELGQTVRIQDIEGLNAS